MIVPRTQPSAASDQTNPGPQPGLADMLMAAAIQAKFAKRMPGAGERSPSAKGLKAEQYDMEARTEGPGKIRPEGKGLEPGVEPMMTKEDQNI